MAENNAGSELIPAEPVNRPLPTVPVEILSKILLMTKHRMLYDLAPSRTLARCALVSKHWLHAARLALYTCVYLGNKDDGLLDACHHLLRTFRRSPFLASLVLEIRFGSLRMNRSETATLAKIIRLCPNLKDVEIHGWNGYEMKALRGALGDKTGLRNVLFSRYAMSDAQCDFFHHLPQFFEMIQRWPDLRSLIVYRDTLGFSQVPFTDDEGDVEERERQHLAANFAVQDGACPHLTHVTILSDIEDRHLVALSRIAPALITLFLSGQRVTADGFGHALEAWKDTIEDIELEESALKYYRPHPYPDRLHDILPSLSKLRMFRFYAKYILITVLSKGFPSLELLQISLQNQDELPVLHDILRTGGLPALKTLCITLPHSFHGPATAEGFPPGVWDTFKKVCIERGVELQEKWTLQDELAEGGALPRMKIDWWLERSRHFKIGGAYDMERDGGSSLGDEEEYWDEDEYDDDDEEDDDEEMSDELDEFDQEGEDWEDDDDYLDSADEDMHAADELERADESHEADVPRRP